MFLLTGGGFQWWVGSLEEGRIFILRHTLVYDSTRDRRTVLTELVTMGFDEILELTAYVISKICASVLLL